MKSRLRPIKQILDRLTLIEDLRTAFFESHWKPWFEKVRKVERIQFKCPGTFWGYLGKEKILFEVNDFSYSHTAPTSKTALTLVADDNDLPLMMGNPAYDTDVLEQRLKGIKGFPHRQDLTDEFVRLDLRNNHLNATFGGYERELLNRFYCNLILGKNKINPPRLLIIKRKNRTFCIDLKEKRLIRQWEIVFKSC